LLKSLSDGNISPEEALRIVAEAKLLRDEATGMFKALTDKYGIIPFRDVLAGVEQFNDRDDERDIRTSEKKCWLCAANILETCLLNTSVRKRILKN
jgi:hypothetical protein